MQKQKHRLQTTILSEPSLLATRWIGHTHMNSPVNKTPKEVEAVDNVPLVIVVMGVSGCGKSTVAEYIARDVAALGIEVHCKDADELHPSSNIDKMAAGLALTDEDRQPWLEQVATYAHDKAKQHGVCVVACSALKMQYRQTLNTAGRVVYVYLQGSYQLIAARMHERTGHFMPETLLDSQFAALEDPSDEPNVLTVSIEPSPDVVATDAIRLLVQHQHLKTDL